MEQELTDHDVIELERRAREMTSLIFALSEKRIKAHPGLPHPGTYRLGRFRHVAAKGPRRLSGDREALRITL